MIRVVVADDSPTARALLVAILSSDPEIQVVAEAADGVEAVERTRKLRPDLVTMDLRMPRMDGFAATKEIMVTAPTPIIIVTASLSVNDVEISLHTLRAGALGVLAKPCGPGSPGFAEASEQLLSHVKALSQVKVIRHWRSASRSGNSPSPSGEDGKAKETASPARIVAMATSTGGPAALHRILGALPGEFPAPILVVQHITHGFGAGLAEWLNKESNLHVKMPEDGETLASHTVYLAPDDWHLGVSNRRRILLAQSPPVGGFRPSGTFLFESVAESHGASAVAVILTGMGEDGVEGLRAIRKAGGRVVAQDEKTSTIFGMPGVAIAAGLADHVLPLDAIAPRLVEWVQHP